MKLYGLMITKDDHGIFADWCQDQLGLYDAVICLDGSEDQATSHIAQQFADRLLYFHESHFYLPYKTDHGLRRAVHQEIVRRFGTDNWIMCCHADEFCYHDPRKAAEQATRTGCDWVGWYSLQFYPHPSELPYWPRLVNEPVPQRIRHYHWNYHGSGAPWIESRLYRNGAHVEWDRTTHNFTLPHGVSQMASFHPILRHYKVFDVDPAVYERSGRASYYRTHWAGMPDRTGVAFAVERMQDLFVSSIPDYESSGRFDGIFHESWNMGDEFRPNESG
jgi:hypothetical protein